MQSADVLRLQADAAVQLTKPANLMSKLSSLADCIPCHSPRRPTSTSMERHERWKSCLNIAWFCKIAEQTAMQEIYDRIAPGIPQIGFVAMRNNGQQCAYLGYFQGSRDRLGADLRTRNRRPDGSNRT